VTNTNEPERIRPFADFLVEHGRGRTHAELGEGLHTLIARVKDTGKKGSVTLTVTVEPMKKAGDDKTVVVSDSISLKLPEHDRPGAVWFIGDDGNLQKDDPDQLTFDSLREVPPPGMNPTTGEVPIPNAKEA